VPQADKLLKVQLVAQPWNHRAVAIYAMENPCNVSDFLSRNDDIAAFEYSRTGPDCSPISNEDTLIADSHSCFFF